MRLGWAKLLKRVFDLDLEHCSNCGGELRVILVSSDTKGSEDLCTYLTPGPPCPGRPAIEKILTQVGLEARAPPREPALGQIAHNQ
jgi:hypothetical protein